MNSRHHVFALFANCSFLLVVLANGPNCWALNVYFNGSTSNDFLTATNWTPAGVPGNNLFDTYGIDDGNNVVLSGGNPIVNGLRVGSVDKTHNAASPNHFGRLTLTGATLGVIGTNLLSIGRENQAYYPVA